jgi:hypothetical protein
MPARGGGPTSSRASNLTIGLPTNAVRMTLADRAMSPIGMIVEW